MCINLMHVMALYKLQASLCKATFHCVGTNGGLSGLLRWSLPAEQICETFLPCLPDQALPWPLGVVAFCEMETRFANTICVRGSLALSVLLETSGSTDTV